MNRMQALALVAQLLGPHLASPVQPRVRPGQAPPPPPLGAYPGPQRARGGINWAGESFADPGALVAWMNARGQQTSVGQFLGNHPAIAQRYGSRQAQVVAGHPRPVVPRPRQAYPY